jgi:hypothetical protein
VWQHQSHRQTSHHSEQIRKWFSQCLERHRIFLQDNVSPRTPRVWTRHRRMEGSSLQGTTRTPGGPYGTGRKLLKFASGNRRSFIHSCIPSSVCSGNISRGPYSSLGSVK